MDSKWVFKTKFKANGEVERFKARLVAKWFQQDPGINFGNTFNPVAKMTTLRLILAIAVSLNWPIKQIDINNAILNRVLQEDVYMWQPKGFEDQHFPHHVCKLQKMIYELRQAPRAWFEQLITTLISWEFVNRKGDSSLIILKTKSAVIILLIYVDDILVISSNISDLKRFIAKLNLIFSLKDLGDLHYFLGFEICGNDSGLFMSQKKYIHDLLLKFNLSNATASSTPMSAGK